MIWAAANAEPTVLWLALACLVFGFAVSYSRARGEAEGWEMAVGIFERSDRLVVAGAATLAVGLRAVVGVGGSDGQRVTRTVGGVDPAGQLRRGDALRR